MNAQSVLTQVAILTDKLSDTLFLVANDNNPDNDKAALLDAKLTLAAGINAINQFFEQPEPPVYPPIDYARYNQEPYTLLVAALSPPEFRNGLPPNWNWSEWAMVNNRPDPSLRPETPGEPVDRSGTNLDEPGRREGTIDANHPVTFTFTVPAGAKQLELTLAGLRGDFFTKGWSRLNDGDSVPFEVSAGRSRIKVIVPNPVPGRYSWTVSINNKAYCGVQKTVAF